MTEFKELKRKFESLSLNDNIEPIPQKKVFMDQFKCLKVDISVDAGGETKSNEEIFLFGYSKPIRQIEFVTLDTTLAISKAIKNEQRMQTENSMLSIVPYNWMQTQLQNNRISKFKEDTYIPLTPIFKEIRDNQIVKNEQ